MVDDKIHYNKVVGRHKRVHVKRKEVVGELTRSEKLNRLFVFFFVISFFLFGIDVYVLFIVYPYAWEYIGLFGVLGCFCLILGLVFRDLDRVIVFFESFILDLRAVFFDVRFLFFVIGSLLLFVLYVILLFV